MELLNKKGLTLIELMVTTAIISMVGAGVGTLAYEGMRLWNVVRDHSEAQENARSAFRGMVSEIREMIIADNGDYPLEATGDFSIVFYANVDDDDEREKVKYEVVDQVLYRWAVEADDAEPPQYPDFTENDRTTVARDIINEDYVFRYFDSSYNGETDPLAEPFDVNKVSLVQIKLFVDNDPNRSPAPVEVETNISLRNLKYKYDN